MPWEEVAFLIRAVEWVAEYGGELLSEYTFIPESGEWKHTRYRYERTLLDVHSLFATKLCHFSLCFYGAFRPTGSNQNQGAGFKMLHSPPRAWPLLLRA